MALEESIKPNDIVEIVEGIRFVIDPKLTSIFEKNKLDYIDGYLGVGDFLLKEI